MRDLVCVCRKTTIQNIANRDFWICDCLWIAVPFHHHFHLSKNNFIYFSFTNDCVAINYLLHSTFACFWAHPFSCPFQKRCWVFSSYVLLLHNADARLHCCHLCRNSDPDWKICQMENGRSFFPLNKNILFYIFFLLSIWNDLIFVTVSLKTKFVLKRISKMAEFMRNMTEEYRYDLLMRKYGKCWWCRNSSST